MPANQIYTQEELKSLHYIIAPWLIGCLLDLLTQGIIFCQVRHNLSVRPELHGR